MITYDEVREQTVEVVREFLEKTELEEKTILVIGCSSSEIRGAQIGKGTDFNTAKAVYEGAQSVLRPRGIFLAAQCCEHLNRAVIVERAAIPPGTEIVNVVPQPHAGSSFATALYEDAEDPVALEEIRADAGIDIGDTLIGMHLKRVAVPVRIAQKRIGEANVVCARTRPKYIGGERAVYDPRLTGDEIRR